MGFQEVASAGVRSRRAEMKRKVILLQEILDFHSPLSPTDEASRCSASRNGKDLDEALPTALSTPGKARISL